MSKPLYVNQPFREFDEVDIAIGFEGEAKVIWLGNWESLVSVINT